MRTIPSPSPRAAALAGALVLVVAASSARAQVTVTPAPDPAALLASDDARLAANKRLVADFWREVIEAQHLERVDRYLAEDYVQHNPTVPTGRAGFVAFFSRFARPKAIAPAIRGPLVAVVAEGDLVVLSFVDRMADAKDPAGGSTTTWFDMFRVRDGRIVEHWDPARK